MNSSQTFTVGSVVWVQNPNTKQFVRGLVSAVGPFNISVLDPAAQYVFDVYPSSPITPACDELFPLGTRVTSVAGGFGGTVTGYEFEIPDLWLGIFLFKEFVNIFLYLII